MPLFLLTEWKWLLPTLAAGFFALMWGITDLQYSHLKTEVAENAIKASEAARAQDAKYAALAQEVEVAHNERAKAVEDAADAARNLARSRGLFVRAKCNMPQTASGSSGIADGAAEVRLDEQTSDALISIARDGDRAAAYAQTCHEWAKSIGH